MAVVSSGNFPKPLLAMGRSVLDAREFVHDRETYKKKRSPLFCVLAFSSCQLQRVFGYCPLVGHRGLGVHVRV